jgi:MEMO1 family protein
MKMVNAVVRMPAVAGQFYPSEPEVLARAVGQYLGATGTEPARPALALMAPHAGYVYSGAVAGRGFAAVAVPKHVIVLCPNHTGRGQPVAVIASGALRIPGADIPVDAELAARVIDEVADATPDWEAHRHEHAIEVELPFLLARQPDLRVVPVVVSGMGENQAIELGRSLARCARAIADEVLLVASSDMSHYLPDADARAADQRALAPLLAFDPRGLYQTVVSQRITMCGVIPATAMLAYAAQMGGTAAPRLVAYATSGDAFGDRSRVVGYASVVVPRLPLA